jgi:thiosulfate/3-mercaptopyruvate sulfurtransferase
MRIDNRRRSQSLRRILQACGFIAIAFTVSLLALRGGMMQRATVQAAPGQAQNKASKPQAPPDPWAVSETVAPADLIKELRDPNPANRPVVVCVGFRFLYDGGHVPGASFHGPASKDEGLADLKAWAQGLPKSSNVVLYCGCCPLARCPNLRPAFTALHDVGFARLRVLLLPTNFGTDWADKGYPVEKSK